MAREDLAPASAPRPSGGPLTQLRSTLITTSLHSVRTHGYFDRYVEVLAPQHRATILEVVAGVWLPIEVGLAHYRACDALGLTQQQQLAIGQEVGARVQGTFLGVVVRSAKTAGVTPWAGLEQANRLWERLFVGGYVRVTRVGPKEAEVALEENPLCGIAYFRNALRGLIVGGAHLFSQKAYANEMVRQTTGRSFAVRLSWV